MSLDNVGVQVSQQIMSGFKDSMREYENQMRENEDKIKRYTIDQSLDKVKNKAVDKTIDGAKNVMKDKVVNKAEKEVVKNARQEATDLLGTTLAPATGGASKVASKTINAAENVKDTIDKVKDENVEKNKAKDLLKDTIEKKDPKKIIADKALSQNSNEKNQKPDRSAAIISGSKDAINKLDRIGDIGR